MEAASRDAEGPRPSREDALASRTFDGGRSHTVVRAAWVTRFPEGRVPSLAFLLGLPHESLVAEPTRILRKIPLTSGPALFLKVYLFSPLTGLRSLFSRTIAEREFERLSLFERAGIPVATPIGWAVERRGGIVRAAAVLEEALAHSIDLQAYAARLGPRAQDASDDERGAVLDALGKLFRSTHERGLACGPKGAHIRNVLLVGDAEGAPRLAFVDLPNALEASGGALERERARDLGRLVIRLAGAYGDEGRARFLAAYLGPAVAPEERRRLEQAIEAERRIAADETTGASLRKIARRIFRRLFGLRGKRRPADAPPSAAPGGASGEPSAGRVGRGFPPPGQEPSGTLPGDGPRPV